MLRMPVILLGIPDASWHTGRLSASSSRHGSSFSRPAFHGDIIPQCVLIGDTAAGALSYDLTLFGTAHDTKPPRVHSEST